MYEYQAIIREIYDGDTVTADIDVGLNTWLHGQKLRLYGVNAPEMRGDSKAQGTISRDWLREKVLGKSVIIRTHKDKTEKYGRWLAEIFIDGGCVNDSLVEVGLAVRYMVD